MIINLVLACAWAVEYGIKNVLFLKCRVIAGAAQLEGRASSFVEANVEKEFGHWINAASEGQLCPEADARAAGGKAGVIWAAVALNRTVLATVESYDRGNHVG